MPTYTKVRFDNVVFTAGTGEVAVNITSMKYKSETKWTDTSDNTTPHDQFEPGYRGLSGTLEGFYDSASPFPFSDGDQVAAAFGFTQTPAPTTSNTLTIPKFCIKSVDTSGDPGAPQLKCSIEWMCSGIWTQLAGTSARSTTVETGTGAGDQ
jgi:hypothetical protein